MDYRVISLINHLSLVRGDLVKLIDIETPETQPAITRMEENADKIERDIEFLKKAYP